MRRIMLWRSGATKLFSLGTGCSKRNCNQIKAFGCSIGVKIIQNLSSVLAVATLCPLAPDKIPVNFSY